MKNRSFWVLTVCGLVCLALSLAVYFGCSVTESLTDIINYRQTGNAGKITNENSLTQSFQCKYDHVTGLSVRISTLGNTFEKGEALLTLADEAGKTLATQQVALAGIKDKSMIDFTFDKMDGIKNTRLTLTVAAQGLEKEQAYSLMIGQGDVGGKLTTPDGKESEKNSLFLTVNYNNLIRPMDAVYLLLIAAVVIFSLIPMAFGRKGGC